MKIKINKNMKKNLIILGATLLIGTNTFTQEYKIGITQIVQHSVLDSARHGFERALKDNKIEYKLDYQNAQGGMPTQQLIASSLIVKKKT